MYSVTRIRRQRDLGECYIEQMDSVISIKLVLSNGSKIVTKIIVTMHLSHFLMLCCWTEKKLYSNLFSKPLIIHQIVQLFELFIKFKGIDTWDNLNGSATHRIRKFFLFVNPTQNTPLGWAGSVWEIVSSVLTWMIPILVLPRSSLLKTLTHTCCELIFTRAVLTSGIFMTREDRVLYEWT